MVSLPTAGGSYAGSLFRSRGYTVVRAITETIKMTCVKCCYCFLAFIVFLQIELSVILSGILSIVKP